MKKQTFLYLAIFLFIIFGGLFNTTNAADTGDAGIVDYAPGPNTKPLNSGSVDYAPGPYDGTTTISSSSGSGFWSSVESSINDFFDGSESSLSNPGGSSRTSSSSGGVWSVGSISGLGLPSGSLMNIINGILAWLLTIIGIVAVIGFIISGAMYILSAGNDDLAGKAKTAMTNSIIGIIVALSGYVVIQAVDAILMGWNNF